MEAFSAVLWEQKYTIASAGRQKTRAPEIDFFQ
jgi:hypothetical protein